MGIGEVVAQSTKVLVPESEPPTVTLREILETVGALFLRPAASETRTLDLPIGEPMVVGPDEPISGLTDELVLLTGGRESVARIGDALARVADAGGRAVVVKSWGADLAEAVRAAEELGVTLLITSDDTAWRQLDAMVTAVCTAPVRIGPDHGDAVSGDLFTLANSIAASLGGPVTIEKTSGRILAYSNLPGQGIDEIRRLAILERQTPQRPTNDEEYRAIIRGPGPVKFESSHPAYADRMAVAIRAGHRVLGVIFVLCDRPRLVEDADHVLVDAAHATALHLLRAGVGRHDHDRIRRSEAVRGLVAGHTMAGAAATALGVPETTPVAMATVRPAPGTPPANAEAVTARAADLAGLYADYWHPAAASVLERGSITLALPSTGNGGEQVRHQIARLHKLGTDLVAAARRAGGVELVVGIGPMLPLADAARSHHLAEQIADVLRARSERVATLDDVRSAVVLAAFGAGRPVDDDLLVLPQVSALLEHDAEHGTEYAHTLLVHLGCAGDVAATAEALHVHENTARYRMRRLDEMFGIDLADGDETLVTWLQVRAALHR
ncbi:helix-turn-helix domain-containing protein [Amycolatopsis ultiminotia]